MTFLCGIDKFEWLNLVLQYVGEGDEASFAAED
jgi:hypothetical protein